MTTLAKLLGPGGAKAIVADSLLMKQQLLVISRSRKRAPNLSVLDRFLLGFWSLFLSPHHIQRSAIILRSSTLLRFHEALKQRKYRLLYTDFTPPKSAKPLASTGLDGNFGFHAGGYRVTCNKPSISSCSGVGMLFW